MNYESRIMMGKFFILAISILSFLFSSQDAFAENDIKNINSNTTITQNTVWENTIVIDGAIVTIDSTATLTIKPGAIIAGKNGASIMVLGKLYALGEENKKIRFTEEENRDKQFSLSYSIYTANGSELELKNFILEKGGGNKDTATSPALTVKGKARISDGIIRRNRIVAARIWNADTKIKNCEIYENESIALENKSSAEMEVEGNWWGTDEQPKNTSSPGGNWLSENFDYEPWQKKGPIPIVVVPGFGGSFSLRLLNDKAKDEWWLPQVGVSAYRHIAKALILNNYYHDKDFYWGFYDWRLPCSESAIKYLEPVIAKAKSASGHFQVHLLTHSMGGLVARSYVQGEEFKDDVDRLVMAGTPNLGSSTTYPIWEGGELSGGKKPITLYLWYLQAMDKNWNRVEYIRENFSSLGQMRPVYDYLVDATSNNIISYKSQRGHNEFLDSLDDKIDKLKRKVNIGIIAGTGEKTLEKIPVLSYAENNGKWRDGIPNPLVPLEDTNKGDGTVTVKSATGDSKLTEEISTIESEHSKLFQKADKTIFNELRVQAKFPLLYKAMHHFLLSVRGPVDVEIENQAGKILNKTRRDIKDSQFNLLENGQDGLVYSDFPVDIDEQSEINLKITFTGKEEGNSKAAFWYLTDDDEMTNIDKEFSVGSGVKVAYDIALENSSDGEPRINLKKVTWSNLLRITNPKENSAHLNWQYLNPKANIEQSSVNLDNVQINYEMDGDPVGDKTALGLLKLGKHRLKARGDWEINGEKQNEEKETEFLVTTSYKSLITLINRYYEEQKMVDWETRSELINFIAEAYQDSSNGRLPGAKEKIFEAKRLLNASDENIFTDIAVKDKLIESTESIESNLLAHR